MTSRVASYFLFEVIVDNGFKGQQFVLKGNEIYYALHFHTRYVTQALGPRDTTILSGFKITRITEKQSKEYFHGYPEEIRKLRNKNRRYGQNHVIPVIGTINIGKFAGTEFAFFGSSDIPPFFSQGVISSVIHGRIRQHKGCSFRMATHKEAMLFHEKLTDEMIDDLSRYETVVKPTVAIPLRGKYQGIVYPLVASNMVNEFFSSTMVRGVAVGQKTSYKGFIFKAVTYDEIKGNDNKLSREIVDETSDALKVPVIARIIKGEMKGHEFGMIYSSVLEKYFNKRSLQAVVRGDRIAYSNCHFRAATYEEAAALTDQFTLDAVIAVTPKKKKKTD